MESMLRIMKALGESHRLKAFLTLLGTGELCVCEIAEVLGLSAATTSRHMGILCSAGLIESKKRGKWVYYAPARAIHPLLLQWVTASADGSFSPENEREQVREKLQCCLKDSGKT